MNEKYAKKKFSPKDYLITHMLIQSDEKLFKCTFCPKTFAQKA